MQFTRAVCNIRVEYAIYPLFLGRRGVKASSLLVLQDGVFQFVHVCAREFFDLLVALHEDEGGHRVDVVLCGDVFALVHVDLEGKR